MEILRCVIALCCSVVVRGYPGFRNAIPNGDKVPHPCDSSKIWGPVGHMSDSMPIDRNPFGMDFKNVSIGNRGWSRALCYADSDGDGVSNGEELGDPNCTWDMNQLRTPGRPTGHPGFCEPGRRKCGNELSKQLSCNNTPGGTRPFIPKEKSGPHPNSSKNPNRRVPGVIPRGALSNRGLMPGAAMAGGSGMAGGMGIGMGTAGRGMGIAAGQGISNMAGLGGISGGAGLGAMGTGMNTGPMQGMGTMGTGMGFVGGAGVGSMGSIPSVPNVALEQQRLRLLEARRRQLYLQRLQRQWAAQRRVRAQLAALGRRSWTAGTSPTGGTTGRRFIPSYPGAYPSYF